MYPPRHTPHPSEVRAEIQTIHAPAAKLPKHIALKKALLEIGSVVKLKQKYLNYICLR